MLKPLVMIAVLVLAGLGGLIAGDRLGRAAAPVTPDGVAGDDGAIMPVAAASSGGPVSHFRFPSQFFVPVMRGDRLAGMMVLTLTLEMPAARVEEVYSQEFRLRDALLRGLLIQANTGGFDGNFTTEPRMRRLREALQVAAADASGGIVTDVLIEDIARQDAP
ncbi:MAG: hypothetical protein Q4G25_04075 [Paracoccus sp. (in: a-proteobacteria)]|nr:hypothetical protein [Paracoccus sp. (in: a-proteobacteria)]